MGVLMGTYRDAEHRVRGDLAQMLYEHLIDRRRFRVRGREYDVLGLEEGKALGFDDEALLLRTADGNVFEVELEAQAMFVQGIVRGNGSREEPVRLSEEDA